MLNFIASLKFWNYVFVFWVDQNKWLPVASGLVVPVPKHHDLKLYQSVAACSIPLESVRGGGVMKELLGGEEENSYRFSQE
jgi:hypothetical protein